VETKIPIYELLHHNITSTLSTTWWCWGKEVSMYKLTIIALASLKKLTLLVWAPRIGNQTQSSIITKWSHIYIRKKLSICFFCVLLFCLCLFAFFVCLLAQLLLFVWVLVCSLVVFVSNQETKHDFCVQ